MENFIKFLKEQTAKAIEVGKEKAAVIAKKKEAADQKKKLAEEAKAKKIINQIPERANYESQQGRNYAVVMSFKEDYERPYNENNYNLCKPSWLKGVAKIVYDYCSEAGFNPTIESWWTGDGMDSGYNIVIHW